MPEYLRTVDWSDGKLVLIDQTRIPDSLEYVQLKSVGEVIHAIKTMVVRGAPAIGAAGAYGVALALKEFCGDTDALSVAVDGLRDARPTAVNLAWAVSRVMRRVQPLLQSNDWSGAYAAAINEADAISAEDMAANEAIAEYGSALIPDGASILTHCNTGDLATVSGGTAVGVIRRAFEKGRKLIVFADETRPRFQGLRLTAWELARAGIPVKVVPDGAGAFLMRRGEIDLVIVGADRIAANGDVANKIGTYSAAVNAREHNIPFYVAAPISTIDLACPSADKIPIEQRDASEVLDGAGVSVAPFGVGVLNLAFDTTPAEYITGIITERGILYPEYPASIREICER